MPKPLLVEEIVRLVRSQLKPRLIFSRSVETLVREKVEVPRYFRLAVLILRTINSHNRRLVAIVERTLSAETRALLDALLIQETANENIVPGKTSAYRLTLMKKLSQSTKPSKVKERACDLALVERLYQSLKPILDELSLNQDGIQYYAHSVIKSEIFQLTRREEKDRYLHLLAFIAHQYYRLQDNLVDVLLSSLQSFQNGALREHKEQCYARRELSSAPELFLNACGRPMTRVGFTYLLRKHVSTAARSCPSLLEKQVSPHLLRHTCAMMLFQATGDLRKVSLWLGHAHMQTTEIYLRADPTEKIEAIEGVTPPALRRGRFTVPDKLIASLRGA